MKLNESIVEDAALTWFRALGYAIGHWPLNLSIPSRTHATLCNALLPRLLSGKLRKRKIGEDS